VTDQIAVEIRPYRPEPWQARGELWIAIPGRRAVPHQFWARITDPESPYQIQLEVQVVGPANVAGVRSLVVSRLEDTLPFGPDVTAAGVRAINIRRYLRLALERAARPIVDAEHVTGVPGTFWVEGMQESGAFGGARVTSVGGRGSRTGQFRLELVADTYKAAKAAGQPVREAVMLACHVEKSQAQRLIRSAREAGKLPPR